MGPNIPPTDDNCLGYKIRTRYVTDSPCGFLPAGSASFILACEESAVTIRAINQASLTLSQIPDDVTVDCSNVPSPATVTAIDICNGLPLTVLFLHLLSRVHVVVITLSRGHGLPLMHVVIP